MSENSALTKHRENTSYYYNLKQRVLTTNYDGLSVLDDDRLYGSIAAYAFMGASELRTVSLSRVTGLGRGAFSRCINLSSVNLPNLEFLDDAFASTPITELNYQRLTYISMRYVPANIVSINIPNASGYISLNNLNALKYLNASKITSIGTSCFNNCINLESIYLPLVSSLYMSSNIFYNCQKLSIINMPNVSTISLYLNGWNTTYPGSVNAFYSCSSLKVIRFPNVSMSFLNSSFFSRISPFIEEMHFGNITSVSMYAFYYMSKLKTLRFTNVNSIYSYVFNSCSNLMSLYIFNTTSVPYISSIYSAGLANTPFWRSINGEYASLYVPINMVDSYLASYSWSYCIPSFSSRIVGLTENDILSLKREWGEIV